MSTISGRYISSSCENCNFWTEGKRQGVCSQRVKTTEGFFVQRITFNDEVCTTHEDDDIKTKFEFFIKKDGSIAINGSYTKNMLLKMKEYLDEQIKKP